MNDHEARATSRSHEPRDTSHELPAVMPAVGRAGGKRPIETHAVNVRGVEYQAEKLTGNRAQAALDVRGEVGGQPQEYVRAGGLPHRMGEGNEESRPEVLVYGRGNHLGHPFHQHECRLSRESDGCGSRFGMDASEWTYLVGRWDPSI